MPGPLPKPDGQRRRRNAPTIPTSALPAAGCELDAPDPPEWVTLGPSGRAWWEWAWHTPQAAGWSAEAHLDAVAHRASLEDDIAAIESEDLAGVSDERLRELVTTLKGLVTGKSTVLSRMKDYDDRLGLTPKSMAQLRWTIVESKGEEKRQGTDGDGNVVAIDSRWQRQTGS